MSKKGTHAHAPLGSHGSKNMDGSPKPCTLFTQSIRTYLVCSTQQGFPMSIVTANAYLIQTGGLHEACVGPATTMLTGNTCCVEQTKSEGTDGINRADGLGIRGNGLQNHAHGLKLFSFFLPCNPRGGPSFILCQFIL